MHTILYSPTTMVEQNINVNIAPQKSFVVASSGEQCMILISTNQNRSKIKVQYSCEYRYNDSLMAGGVRFPFKCSYVRIYRSTLYQYTGYSWRNQQMCWLYVLCNNTYRYFIETTGSRSLLHRRHMLWRCTN